MAYLPKRHQNNVESLGFKIKYTKILRKELVQQIFNFTEIRVAGKKKETKYYSRTC
jgi:hypothetical protein